MNRNPFTIEIESWMAGIFIIGLAIFFSMFILKVIREFEDELVMLESQRTEVIFERPHGYGPKN